MSKQKSISKSIRLTDEVFNYIDGYRGDGFNQKFENIILDAMCSEAERNKALCLLDTRISQRQKELQDLLEHINRFKEIQRNSVWILRDLEKMQQSVSQMCAAAGRPGCDNEIPGGSDT